MNRGVAKNKLMWYNYIAIIKLIVLYCVEYWLAIFIGSNGAVFIGFNYFSFVIPLNFVLLVLIKVHINSTFIDSIKILTLFSTMRNKNYVLYNLHSFYFCVKLIRNKNYI